jgi:hypothetical protein
VTGKLLKLRAEDGEDMDIISAVLQDAIAPLCDMTYQEPEKTFIMVVHRFCWGEDEKDITEKEEKAFERIRCALTITGVTAVQIHGVNQKDTGQILDLLAVLLQDNNLQFIFAGEARIKLTLADWKLKLEDFGDPWPTTHRPCHS